MFRFCHLSKHENVLTAILKQVDALDTKFTQIYKQQTFKPYSVDGQVTGQYKNAGTFSYLRIYGAGHEVPAYKVCRVILFFCLLFFRFQEADDLCQFGKLDYGEAAAQIFTQIMRNESLFSTQNFFLIDLYRCVIKYVSWTLASH